MTDHQGRQSAARRSLPERGCSTALPCHQKRRDTQQAKRADGFLGALSVFRSGRFAFCHDAA